jgi:hypothetical protein
MLWELKSQEKAAGNLAVRNAAIGPGFDTVRVNLLLTPGE